MSSQVEVDLGFLEECDAWQVQSRLFPSKFGGKPAWLGLENIPFYEELLCEICKNPMIFLCQIYAPFEDPNNFHRTIFVFICRRTACSKRNSANNFRAFRNSLKRENRFYSSEPPIDEEDPSFSLFNWVPLCELCGCYSMTTCGKCKKTHYCSRQHQKLDWKVHKTLCGTNNTSGSLSKSLFPERQIIMEEEDGDIEKKLIDEQAELDKLSQMQIENQAGTLNEVDEKELELLAKVDDDKTFRKFKERVDKYPDQVIRYQRGGKPLWIAKEPIPANIPNCEYCGSPRQFEFQIMPQTLSIIKENDLDWGVIVIYTCAKSCTDGKEYKNEFIFKQDVELTEM